jgi:hypothetical protein
MANTIIDEIIVTAEELLDKVVELIKKGNVRRMIIKNKDGHKLVELPLTLGAASAGIIMVIAPFLSAVAFVAMLVSEATIVVERDASYDEKEVEAENIEIVE